MRWYKRSFDPPWTTTVGGRCNSSQLWLNTTGNTALHSYLHVWFRTRLWPVAVENTRKSQTKVLPHSSCSHASELKSVRFEIFGNVNCRYTATTLSTQRHGQPGQVSVLTRHWVRQTVRVCVTTHSLPGKQKLGGSELPSKVKVLLGSEKRWVRNRTFETNAQFSRLKTVFLFLKSSKLKQREIRVVGEVCSSSCACEPPGSNTKSCSPRSTENKIILEIWWNEKEKWSKWRT